MLAAIVESSDDAIISKDLNGTIMSWNRGAERVFGYTAEEAVGRPITMLLPPDRFQEEATILGTLVRGERIDHFETERMTKDGRRIDISLSVSPVKDRSGRVIGGAKIARDISLRRQLEREREQVLAQERHVRTLAEAANRAKDAFLAMVSHELRSPLSPILSWVRMLRMKALDEAKSARALETIERSARAQAKLIDDLLDISRIVAGKLRLEVRSVDLASVIEEALEVVRPAAEAKQIRLQTVLDTETGTIPGDPARLQQVIWNLLSNAVKFTPKGGRVQITLERVNSHVEIAISDTGRGVPAEFLSYLFERFQQAETGTARSHGGLGLGLAIVRHIVELHGGTVFAESAGEGQGATFTIKLPRMIFMRTAGEDARRHPTVGPVPEPGDFPSLHDLRVLVVDDEPESNEVVSTILGVSGAEVRVAASAAEGLEHLKQWTPHVIVSDIGMPHGDGYMFLAKLHALPGEMADLPAVALTAYATTDDRVRIFSAGFKAHVVKPIDPVELVVVVANVARHRKS
jgi:PAS domain S-box-containing protein